MAENKSEYGLQMATIGKSMPRAGRTHHSQLSGVMGHWRRVMAEAGLAAGDAESQVKPCQPLSLSLSWYQAAKLTSLLIFPGQTTGFLRSVDLSGHTTAWAFPPSPAGQTMAGYWKTAGALENMVSLWHPSLHPWGAGKHGLWVLYGWTYHAKLDCVGPVFSPFFPGFDDVMGHLEKARLSLIWASCNTGEEKGPMIKWERQKERSCPFETTQHVLIWDPCLQMSQALFCCILCDRREGRRKSERVSCLLHDMCIVYASKLKCACMQLHTWVHLHKMHMCILADMVNKCGSYVGMCTRVHLCRYLSLCGGVVADPLCRCVSVCISMHWCVYHDWLDFQ